MASSPPSAAPASSSFTPLVIDLSPFLTQPHQPVDDKARGQVVAQLREAVSGPGVFLLVGHGVIIGEEVLGLARRFFELDYAAVKSQVPSVATPQGFTRGYIPVFGESGRAKEFSEFKEAFSFGYPWDPERQPGNPLQGPNVWPSEEAVGGGAWRDTLTAFFFEMVRVSKGLCEALSLALGQAATLLPSMCEGGETISLLRLFHYLPLAALPPDLPRERAIGSSPHTDWGFLTLILQDDVGGLQMRLPEGAGGGEGGSWVDVKAPEGALLVNCGDYLSLLARSFGGAAPSVHSPVHRVLLSEDRERLSLVFFYYPSFDAPLPAPPGHDTQQPQDDQGYNTLLVAEGPLPGSFGQHLTRKWAGVQTSSSS